MAGNASCKWDAGNGWMGAYRGQLQDGKPHGHGVLIDAADGDEYDGNFKAGKFHGRGRATYGHLDQYDGEWNDGNYHGHGVRTYDYGSSKYDGQIGRDTSELQSHHDLVCRLLLEKKKKKHNTHIPYIGIQALNQPLTK